MGYTTLEDNFEKPNLSGFLQSRREYLLSFSPSCGFKIAILDVKGEWTCTSRLFLEESSNDMVVSSRGVLEPGKVMIVAFLFFLI